MPNTNAAKPVSRSFTATMVAIAWSFIGLRRKKDFDTDAAAGAMNPFYVLAAALIGAATFIGTLVFFVRVATS